MNGIDEVRSIGGDAGYTLFTAGRWLGVITVTLGLLTLVGCGPRQAPATTGTSEKNQIQSPIVTNTESNPMSSTEAPSTCPPNEGHAGTNERGKDGQGQNGRDGKDGTGNGGNGGNGGNAVGGDGGGATGGAGGVVIGCGSVSNGPGGEFRVVTLMVATPPAAMVATPPAAMVATAGERVHTSGTVVASSHCSCTRRRRSVAVNYHQCARGCSRGLL